MYHSVTLMQQRSKIFQKSVDVTYECSPVRLECITVSGAARGSGGMDGKLIAQISSGPELKSDPQMGIQMLLRFVAGVATATSGTMSAKVLSHNLHMQH